MADKKTYLLRHQQIADSMQTFSHPWNPKSEISGTQMGRFLGLKRTGVNFVKVPPGKESFVYHSHYREEEWIYILSGQGIAEIDGEEFEVGSGDFMAFPTPSVAHHLRNTGNEDLVYLMGGENLDVEIADFPRLGKRMFRREDASQLELVRTQELLSRYLPPPPAAIFDVGGGTGIYSFWLAQQGYEVHLIDAVPLHIEQARRSSESQPDCTLASMAVGDARQLNREDSSVDVVLLLGPLYHLTDRSDRMGALREAHRILRDGGIIFAAGISRFASTLDGLFRGFLDDPEFVSIAQRDLAEGQHRNPNNHPAYFTTAFLHHPQELKTEIEEAGLQCERILAIEGPGWLLQNFEEHWGDSARRDRLLDAIRWLEAEPSTLGMSGHFMAIARKVAR